jgi:hypothetical protein
MKGIKLLILGALIVALLLIGSAVTAMAADPTITITVTKWNIAPLAPTAFEIEQTGVSSINITWTKGIAANITIVRGSTSGYPFSIFDGDSIYSGNGTYAEVGSLGLNTYTYYYRAWSQNEYGTSTGYAQASIDAEAESNADVSALTALIISLIEGPTGIVNMMFAVALMGFGFWKKSWLRVILSVGLIIWGVFVMPYDIKVAAPFIGIGFILFIMGIFQAIEASKEAREEAA